MTVADEEDYWQNLAEVLRRLQLYGIRIKKNKCHFMETAVYLEYWIDSGRFWVRCFLGTLNITAKLCKKSNFSSWRLRSDWLFSSYICEVTRRYLLFYRSKVTKLTVNLLSCRWKTPWKYDWTDWRDFPSDTKAYYSQQYFEAFGLWSCGIFRFEQPGYKI